MYTSCTILKKKMNIYIDTNIFLTFYHYSKEDLKELKKLVTLINAGSITLFLPEQTKNEFYRNRESKIADALKKIRETRLENNYPLITKSYSEFQDLIEANKTFEQLKNKLLEKILYDAENNSLVADDIINQLFEKSDEISTTKDILKRAKIRFDSGNPPGKGKSYGDAINWEALLAKIIMEEDLYIISGDRDFYCVLNPNNFNAFLKKEWKETKNSEIKFFKSLGSFIKEHHPNIDITIESEKDEVIGNLIEAYSFDSAKNAVRKLENYENFSIQQINEIALNFSSNSQIYWIKNDGPIRRIRLNYIEPNLDKLKPEVQRKYKWNFDID